MTAQETPPVSVRLQPRAALRAAGSLLLIVTVAGAFLAAFEGLLRLTGYGETTRPFLPAVLFRAAIYDGGLG